MPPELVFVAFIAAGGLCLAVRSSGSRRMLIAWLTLHGVVIAVIVAYSLAE